MQSAFTSIRFGLMVGIGGGVPSADSNIRLGDVVVSRPENNHGGVVQYDFGKSTPSGFKRTGFLNAPPKILQNAISHLRAKHMRGESRFPEYISKFDRLSTFTRAYAGPDVLFDSHYNHIGGTTCEDCDKERTLTRTSRGQQGSIIHYGTIASGNQVMRDAAERDQVSSDFGGVLCFEMEAAGLMNEFPCLVIRGICDYSDSHKNKRWQPYAAGAAAAYAKELLSIIPANEITRLPAVEETVSKETSKPPCFRLRTIINGLSQVRTPSLQSHTRGMIILSAGNP
jgi:nucleoside phosphorylase